MSTIADEKKPDQTSPFDPIHPGEILQEEFMVPLGLSINKLARELHVPPNRIDGIVHGRCSITADTGLRLSTYFGVSPETWINLQSGYDLRAARLALGDETAKAIRRRDTT